MNTDKGSWGYSGLFEVTVAQPTLTLEVGLNWDKHNLRAYILPTVSSPNNCYYGLVTFLATLSTYSLNHNTSQISTHESSNIFICDDQKWSHIIE